VVRRRQVSCEGRRDGGVFIKLMLILRARCYAAISRPIGVTKKAYNDSWVFVTMENDRTPLAKLPEAWRGTAIGLKRSADIIWERWFGIFSRCEGGKTFEATPQECGDVRLLLPSFLLLAGLALENALKGLLISNDPSIVDSRVKWDIGSGGHDLGALLESIGLSPTSEEKEFLDALTQAVLWSGRYPVPKYHGNESDIGIPLGPFFRNIDIASAVSCMSEMKNVFNSLYSQVLKRYPEPKGKLGSATDS